MVWLDRWIRWSIAVAAMAGLTWGQGNPVDAAEVIRLPAKETLTAVEMDHGDELRVTLHDGRVVSLTLEDSSATIIQRVEPGGVIYQFSLQMRVDGQPMTMRRQIFEDRRRQQGEVRAAMSPLAPVAAGQPVRFSADGSQPGRDRQDLTYHWTFGDGGVGYGHAPQHVFAGPGIYPVTLVVDDGLARATHTQHVVVSGSPTDQPVLVLTSPESPSFVRRPVHAVDTYGAAVDRLPHTLEFVAAASRPRPASQSVRLQNPGGGRLDQATAQPEEDPTNWLRLETAGQGNSQTLDVSVDATALAPGTYTARVIVESPDAVNSPQAFGVRLKVREATPVEAVIVDDRDPGFFATPYFWVGHRFSRVPRNRRGHGGFYLTNGGQAVEGQFARFAPDLAAGQYEVAFSDVTPFPPGSQFTVRIRHSQGETTLRVRPDASRVIGTFTFHEGTDGCVEIQAADSQGLVIADAIQWRPTDPSRNANDAD